VKTTSPQSRTYEFGFPHLDTLVLVEDHGSSVVIRATRDTFSEQRKIAFIRELAAEGFIDDSYRWFSLAGKESYFGVRWRVDFSWLELPAIIITRARRFMLGLQLGGFLVWAVLLVAFLHNTGR
jgi:hypothetical protein